MRPHGRAEINAQHPRALGVCQRCGFLYNHNKLTWQYQWGGTRLFNTRILVCQSCYDTPQQQLRAIILPPDPVSIQYPVPESYASDDNPMSGINFSPTDLTATTPSTSGTFIGTLTAFAGLNAAFDGNTNKQSWRSAGVITSVSSYQNTIGKNWNAGLSGFPSGITPATVKYTVSEFSIYAPSDAPIFGGGATGLYFQGSNNGVTWTTLYSTTTTGTAGESLTSTSSNLTTGDYQYHQIVIRGDGVNQISVAQVEFSVSNTGQNEQ